MAGRFLEELLRPGFRSIWGRAFTAGVLSWRRGGFSHRVRWGMPVRTSRYPPARLSARVAFLSADEYYADATSTDTR